MNVKCSLGDVLFSNNHEYDELREARIEKNSSTLIHHGVPFDCGLAIADFGFGTNEHVLYQDNPKSAIQRGLRGEARRARIFPLGSDSGIVPTLPHVTSTVVLPTVLSYFLV